MTDTGYVTKGEKEEIREKEETVYFKSDIAFINAHWGYRPGMVHLIIGPTGGGKSTLVRTMLADAVKHLEGRRALLVLTEESIQQFYASMLNLDCTDLKWLKLIIKTEDSLIQERGSSYFLNTLSDYIGKEKIDIVFYDNITTSDLYKGGPEAQETFAKRMKLAVCQRHEIPMILVAHTRAEITVNCNTIIGPEDVRYSKQLSILADYLYTIQVVDTPTTRYQFVKRHKGRGKDHDNSFFWLGFNKGIFDRVVRIDFADFKAIFEQRQSLINKGKK